MSQIIFIALMTIKIRFNQFKSMLNYDMSNKDPFLNHSRLYNNIKLRIEKDDLVHHH